METLAFVLAVIVAFSAGYRYERLLDSVKNVQKVLKEKANAKKMPIEDKSIFLDPLDPILQAKMEHDRLLKRLNPEAYDE